MCESAFTPPHPASLFFSLDNLNETVTARVELCPVSGRDERGALFYTECGCPLLYMATVIFLCVQKNVSWCFSANTPHTPSGGPGICLRALRIDIFFFLAFWKTPPYTLPADLSWQRCSLCMPSSGNTPNKPRTGLFLARRREKQSCRFLLVAFRGGVGLGAV